MAFDGRTALPKCLSCAGVCLWRWWHVIHLLVFCGICRWNQLKADETGIMLQLLPMLLGFFTYKAALVSKQAGTLLSDLAGSAKAEAQGPASAE